MQQTALGRMIAAYTDVERVAHIANAGRGAPLAVLKFDLACAGVTHLEERLPNGGLCCSDGTVFDATGLAHPSPHKSLMLVAPARESMRDLLERRLRGQLTNFPWRGLSYEQLDACLKFAEAKLSHNHQKEAA